MVGTAGPRTNSDLDRLHDMLIAASQALHDKLGSVTDPDLADAIVTEMREVVHRIDLVQSLLFTAESDGIARAVQGVQAANAGLAASIDAVTQVTKLVDLVTNFLTLVDTAIDLAKKIP